MPSTNDIQAIVVNEAGRLPQFARSVLDADPVQANTFLPTLHKLTAMEANGQPLEGQLWVVIHVGRDVKFIASCTRGYMGDYPLFIFTPIPAHLHHPEPMKPLLWHLACALTNSLPTRRIYSVFAPEVVTTTFAAIWTERTGINTEPVPYYHAKISYATAQSVQRFDRSIAPIPGARCDMRAAIPADLEGVAGLCYDFAATSPPFTLTWDAALREARTLINEHQVWVYTATFQDGRTGIASIVAFTRNTNVAAAITKVYTHTKFRSLGCAERLVRKVCKHLLSTRPYVVLYVGLDNRAANVYKKVGFFGIGENAEPVKGVDNYLELGFDRSRVRLGHW